MEIKNSFNQLDVEEFKTRINNLTNESQAKWGKMDVAQMLAHLCVAYEMAYTDKHPKPKGFMKIMLKLMVKKTVIGTKPYKQNLRTGPQFIIADKKEFDFEKTRLIKFIDKTLELGESHFNNRESHSLGVLTYKEWSNSFSKHLDHHLTQFGV